MARKLNTLHLLDNEPGTLQSALRIFARNYDLELDFNGLGASTDCKRHVSLPANTEHLPNLTKQLIRGMLYHEGGHGREQRRAEERQRKGHKCLTLEEAMEKECHDSTDRMLLNVFEDVRNDDEAGKGEAGVKEDLDALARYFVTRYEDATFPGRADPWQVIGTAVIFAAKHLSNDWAPPEAHLALELLDDEVEAIRKAGSVDESLAISRSAKAKLKALFDAMRKEAEKRAEPGSDGDGDAGASDKGEPGEPGEGGGEGGDTGDGEPSEGGEGGEGGGSGDSKPDSEGGEGGEGSDEGEGASGDDSPDSGDVRGDKGEGGGKPGKPKPSDDGADGEGSGGSDGEDKGEGDIAPPTGGKGGSSSDGDSKGDTPGDASPSDGSSKPGGKPTDGDSESTTVGEGGTPGGGDTHRSKVEKVVHGLPSDKLEEALEKLAGLDDEAEVEDLLDHVKEAIGEAATDDFESHSSRRWVPDPNVVKHDAWVKPKLGTDEEYRKLKDKVRRQIGALRAKLLVQLQTRAQARVRKGLADGELDDGELWTTRFGNKRVFYDVVPGTKTNTAVSILIDHSGSMGHTKSQRAQETACALAETLDAIGIPFEVIGWNNPEVHHGDYSFSRYLPFRFDVYKEFGEHFKRVRRRMANWRRGEQNVDGEAVFHVAKRLAARPEDRKILFVLSDGEPAGGGDHAAMDWHLGEIVRRVTSAGIEVYGIGMLTSSVERYYNARNGSDNIVINNIDELALKVFKLMRQKLTGAVTGRARLRRRSA